MSDRVRLYVAVGLRALAIGLLGVLLAFHLGDHGFDEAVVGSLVSAGLWGMALATVAVGVLADRLGRRRMLVGLSVLGAAGVAVVAWSTDPTAALAAAFLGMLNGAGRDRGALPALEQAVLAATTDDARRTRTFAVYNLFDDAALAVGAVSVWAVRRSVGDTAPPAALREGGVFAAAGLLLAAGIVYASLSASVEPRRQEARVPLSPTTRRRLARVCSLFALDAFGGGFLAAVFLAIYLQQRFGVHEEVMALLLFGSRVLNAVSHLGAAWLARRIGLVNTMVFTHVPSSLLLLAVTAAPSFGLAAGLLLLREGLVEMDVPTRQSYVMAIVRPEERTAVSAATNLVRIVAWAAAAWFAGRLMRDVSIQVPLVASAVLKIAYDVMLYVSFRRLRPPEEAG